MERKVASRTLDNGLRIIAQHVPGVYGSAVSVNYGAGFRSDPAGRAGMAHLFEHMMFQGSEQFPKGEHFSSILACGGKTNGLTFQDVTDFHQLVPASEVPHVLALEADRMHKLSLTEQNLKTQRDVVNEEMSMRITTTPYGGFPWTVLPSYMYSTWANSHNGFGTANDLDSATLHDCYSFYDQYYAPGNAAVGVTGSLAAEEMLDLATTAFGVIGYRRPASTVDLTEPIGVAGGDGSYRDPLAPRPALALGKRLPDITTHFAEYAGYLVLHYLLAGSPNTRLKSVFESLDAEVACSTGFFGPGVARNPDTFVIAARYPRGQRIRALESLDEELMRIANGSVTASEMRRARSCSSVGIYQMLDSLEYRARSLARGVLLFDQPLIMEHLALAVSDVPEEMIARAAADIGKPCERTLLTLDTREDDR